MMGRYNVSLWLGLGRMTFDNKAELIDQVQYDQVIKDWATRTGRPVW